MKILKKPETNCPYTCEYCDALLLIYPDDITVDIVVKYPGQDDYSLSFICLNCGSKITLEGEDIGRLSSAVYYAAIDKYRPI